MITEVVIPDGERSRDAYVLAEDVVYLRLEDGTGRLVDLAGDVFALDDTAAAMLTGVLSQGPQPTIQALASGRGVPPERLRTDLEGLLAQLSRLVLAPGEPQRRRSDGALLVAPLLRACLGWRRLAARAWGLVTLAHVSTRLFGWSPTVRLWNRVVEQAASRCRSQGVGDLPVLEEAVRQVIARHPLEVDCKERALTGYALVRMAGLPARLVLGVYPLPFTSHVWCESGGRLVADRQDDGCDLYTPVRFYEGDHQW